MGPTVGETLTRIGFLLCMDGFPAFHQKHKGAPSLMPAEFINLSLPPHLRYDPDNMLMWLLIPHSMPSEKQRKYFDYICAQELNPLQQRGLNGPDGRCLVKLFGAALDLKGKEKFYDQICVTGYCGCSTCFAHFDQGPKGPINCCSRCFLPADHPLRQKDCEFAGVKLTFRNHETRAAPVTKTTQTIFQCSTLAREMEVEHYLGQKGFPMLMSLEGFKYERFNLLEWMHNLKCSHDNVLDLLIGRDDPKFDLKARKTSEVLGVFPEIWTSNVCYLSDVRQRSLASLRDAVINRADPAWIRRWLKICGIKMDKRSRVDELRSRLKEVRDLAQSGERVPVIGKFKELSWRLSSEGISTVNQRACDLCYPHYTPVCHIGKESFIKRTGCWRTASKLIAFLVILVPILLGFVVPFRTSLRRVVHGLRILEGQTCSVNEARALNLHRCNNYLRKTHIDKARILIITGLAMLEGCCPIMLLVPALHCLCHYGDGAAVWGILKLLWMICFERYNKKCKNLTSNKKFPFRSLSHALIRDATARYYRWRQGYPATRTPKLIETKCCGSSKRADLTRTTLNKFDLLCDCDIIDCDSVAYNGAIIGGKRFTPNECLVPGKRCGSVIIKLIRGRSVYGLVKQFVRVICDCPRVHDFAVVTWLPRPIYPDGDPLTVRIDLNGRDVNTMNNLDVCSLNDIQPCRTIVLIDRTKDCLYMMRMEGLDIVR